MVERELGRGGMAVVYLARDLRHGRDVAVKIFHLAGASESSAERFLQEIQIAAGLSHPNILPLHESGETDGLIFYVMPYVPGETLRQRLDREGAFPVEDALQVARQVAGALSYAHSHGVVHRDIKPENILFLAGQAVVADFGIARAISAGGLDDRLLGVAAGTPTYMSPEQARGSARLDGRSDLYSLGCVLYEMLTGDPPFRGSTPEEIVAAHVDTAPTPVQQIRPTLTPPLQAVVSRALEKLPADRYQTAQQFMEAIDRVAAGAAPAAVQLRPTLVAPRRSAGWLATVGAAALLAIAIYVGAAFRTMGADSGLDQDLLLVAPFVHVEGAGAELVTGDQCELLLSGALARWHDLHLVDRLRLNDLRARDSQPPTLEGQLRLARLAGAGRLLTGEVWAVQDSVQLRGVVYEVGRGGRLVKEARVTVSPDLHDLSARFEELAAALVAGAPTVAVAQGGAMGTSSISAWHAFDSAHVALAGWDLPGAEAGFRAAVERDRDYPQAHLWLAQVQSWQGAPAEQWRDDALNGARMDSLLPPQERDWAEGLAALAREQYPEACARYTTMIKRDAKNFRGWFGRAECQSRDHLVVADAASPSGWRFRSSYQGAINDYQQALTLIPSVYQAFKGASLERLSSLFYGELNTLRPGVKKIGDSPSLYSFPGLADDTLQFIPFPEEWFATRPQDVAPRNGLEAAAHNREALVQVTNAWVRAFPNSVAALEAGSRSLELVGEFSTVGAERDSAVVLLRRARGGVAGPEDALRLGLTDLRLALKLRDFPRVFALADSLLSRGDSVPPRMAGQLAAVAVLAGRPGLASRLQRQAATEQEFASQDGVRLTIPLQLRQAALGLEAYAAVGAPPDTVRRWMTASLQELRNTVRQGERATVSAALLEPVYGAMDPSIMADPSATGRKGEAFHLSLRYALARGDTARVRAGLADLARQRQGSRPGDVAPEGSLQEAWLELGLGDTAAATRRLDTLLLAIPTFGTDLTSRVQQAGALVRAMALRATLAEAAGQHDIARRWAEPVATLWKGADASLLPELQRMERLAKSPS